MKLTVKELKDKLKDLPDNTEVYIERVEDVYFDKHSWQTIDVHFGMVEHHEVFNASSVTKHNDKLIILAHY
jgi:hypothetical protein